MVDALARLLVRQQGEVRFLGVVVITRALHPREPIELAGPFWVTIMKKSVQYTVGEAHTASGCAR